MMRRRSWLASIAVIAAVTAGCGGSDNLSTGSTGASGRAGTTGAAGDAGPRPPHLSPREARKFAAEARAQSGDPRNIAFWDADRGVMGTGSDQYPKDPRFCRGTIALTTDGGQTLQVVKRINGVVAWTDVAGTEDAWAHVIGCRGAEAHSLLHSADGGRSWQALPASGGERMWRPSFANATLGLATVASRGQDATLTADTSQVLATSDGGRSWHAVDRPCRGDGAALSFPSPATAWVVCTRTPGAGAQDKLVFTSTDGARDWDEVARVELEHPEAAGLDEYGYVQGLWFAPGGSGILQQDGGAFRTLDAGRSWQSLPPDALPNPAAPNAHGFAATALSLPSSSLGVALVADHGMWELASSAAPWDSWQPLSSGTFGSTP